MRQTTQLTWLATGLAVALGLAPVYAQKKDDKAAPPQDPKQVLISAIVGATNEAMKGAAGTTVFNADPATRAVTADPATKVEMTLGIDYLKASDNKIYAPFTVTIQPDVIGKGANFGAYIRLAPKGAVPPEAPPPLDEKARKEKEKQDKKNKKKGKEAQDLAGQAVSGVEYPWEDYYDLTATPRGPGGPLTFSRPFSVAAGEYDAYVAVTVKDPAAAPGPLKIAVHKATITVPNYWTDTFQISSVFVANKVTPLAEVPTGEAQKLKPYVIGNLEVTPTVDGKFTSADELSIFFIIYGVALGDDKKPDVTIEWQPFKKGPLGEAKFRGVAPQKLNGETLPPGFDVAQGHQLVGSLNVPVSAFEAGDYRLAIKVTDNKTGKSLTHDVTFAVAGS